MDKKISLNVGRSRTIQVSLEEVVECYNQLCQSPDRAEVTRKIVNSMRCIPYDDQAALERAAVVYGHIYTKSDDVGMSIDPGFKTPHWQGGNQNVYYVAVDDDANDHVIVWLINPNGFDVINDRPLRMSRSQFYSMEYDSPIIFHNLTQNRVTFMDGNGKTAVTLSAANSPCKYSPARKDVGYVVSGNPQGSPVRVPIVMNEGGELTGLPPQEPGHGFIVSKIAHEEIKRRFPYRNDIFVTTGTIRDGEGRIIGCAALTRE